MDTMARGDRPTKRIMQESGKSSIPNLGSIRLLKGREFWTNGMPCMAEWSERAEFLTIPFHFKTACAMDQMVAYLFYILTDEEQFNTGRWISGETIEQALCQEGVYELTEQRMIWWIHPRAQLYSDGAAAGCLRSRPETSLGC